MKKRYQIQTDKGLQVGIVEAFTAHHAMAILAQQKGFNTYEEMQKSFGGTYEEKDNFRIIWR